MGLKGRDVENSTASMEHEYRKGNVFSQLFGKLSYFILSKLPFVRKKFVQVRIGPESQKYDMWFMVVGQNGITRMLGDWYVIHNPHYFRGKRRGEKVFLHFDDPVILEERWSNDTGLLTPSDEYEQFLEQCKKSNYYPDDFIVLHSFVLVS